MFDVSELQRDLHITRQRAYNIGSNVLKSIFALEICMYEYERIPSNIRLDFFLASLLRPKGTSGPF